MRTISQATELNCIINKQITNNPVYKQPVYIEPETKTQRIKEKGTKICQLCRETTRTVCCLKCYVGLVLKGQNLARLLEKIQRNKAMPFADQ